jgi:hypothetical protein
MGWLHSSSAQPRLARERGHPDQPPALAGRPDAPRLLRGWGRHRGRQPQRGGARRWLAQRPTPPKLGLTDTVGQQPIMPHPLEAAGQDLEEEAPQTLAGV